MRRNPHRPGMALSDASVPRIAGRMDTTADGTRRLEDAVAKPIVGKMRRMHAGARKHPKNCTQCVRELLTIAGANVSVRAIARWSRRQRAEAKTWAHEQIAAYARDKPGWQTSVFVPEHVSSANRGWRS